MLGVTMKLCLASSLLTGALAAPSSSSAGAPQVNLGYATYQGTAQHNGQNQFLGIRFASPPLGNLRFRKPQPPTKNSTLQHAIAFGPFCLGTGAQISATTNEDCLFLNVWAPSNATPASKLPVFFWIQGGGYVANSNANYNGSELVTATGNKMVFVNINYRVGAFGFLASEKVRANGDLNVGLLDQRQALLWVQQHITSFGGDPGHVVLVGESAGAGSIAMHLIANNGAPTNLFVGAFGVSPFFPTQPLVSELEWQFDAYASKTGCSGTPDLLACLRGKDSATLQAANSAQTYPGRTGSTLFGFTPTIDGVLIADYPYTMFGSGRFVKVPVIFGDDTDEGTNFAANAATPADVANFMKNNFPRLTTAETDAINAEYPQQAPLPKHAAFFPSAAAAYGETTFVCPGLEISSALSGFAKSWNYRYNVLTPAEIAAGVGVSHTSETANIFGPGNTPAGSSNSSFDFDDISLTPILQGYYTSFVRALDPNAHPVNGSVFWPQFEPVTGKRLLLQVNATTVETVPSDQTKRCEFWKSLAIVMEQ